jgi:hypothetical protein
MWASDSQGTVFQQSWFLASASLGADFNLCLVQIRLQPAATTKQMLYDCFSTVSVSYLGVPEPFTVQLYSVTDSFALSVTDTV